jgi:small subunit ribosomal protein S4
MRYTGPKAKKVRRQGVNIYGADKYDRILQKKPSSPGKGPRARRGKRSEYGTQLLEKQKVRDTFGVSEKQFRRYYREALRSKQATGRRILELLEKRLDNVLFRAGFALTRLQSRQLASHGLFLVNTLRTNIPSHEVKPGDIIEVHPRAASSPLFTNILAATEKLVPPAWLKVDSRALRIEIISQPQQEHFEQALDIQKVVELYSR